MIEFRRGNIFDSNAEALVNSVNCVGVMGRGIALQFKAKFPENFSAYRVACQKGLVQPGRMYVYETGWISNPKYIINFPTKRHWRGRSRIEDIYAGLESLRQEIERRVISTLAIPPLGSGLGGLEWTRVREAIESGLADLPNVRVFVYEPGVKPEVAPPNAVSPPKMTPGRASLVRLMHQYLGGLLDPFVSLLELHKLLYFLQDAGENLKLKFVQAPYGPYAENLRHVLARIEGYYVTGYSGKDLPGNPLFIVPGALVDAEKALTGNESTAMRLRRVAELVDGFETPSGLELLATVHWVASRERHCTSGTIVRRTYEWNERKRRFTERQIKLALQRLENQDWLAPAEE